MEIKPPIIDPTFPPEITRYRVRNKDARNIKIFVVLSLLLLAATIALTQSFGTKGVKAPSVQPTEPLAKIENPWLVTEASWYDYDLVDYPGYSLENPTAASRDYPRGTLLEVCQPEVAKGEGGVCVVARVNDYGPDASVFPERALDLSSYAFHILAPLEQGVLQVVYRMYPPN